MRGGIFIGLVLILLTQIGLGQSINDDIANAIDIDGFKGFCSNDGAFSTEDCTPDLNAGSNWSVTDSLHNVWFEFTAPQNGAASFTIDIGSGNGNQTRSQAAIWSGVDTSQLNSVRYDASGDDIVIAADSLTPGATYYLSVDAQRASRTGTFTLCFDSILDYDFISAAINIDTLKGTCSPDAEYTTYGASPDGYNASCWAGSSPKANRWFEFTAAQNGFAAFTVDINDTKGDQTRSQVAVYENNGFTQISCNRYSGNTDDVELVTGGLTPGQTYLLSVDVQALSRRGSFTICYDTVPSYDYAEAAIDIDTLKGTCSSDAIYTTVGASADRTKGDCWNNNGPLYNRWFKFVGPTTGEVNITVDIGDTKGTQTRSQAVIFAQDTSTQIVCARYGNNDDDIQISSDSIIPGQTYFLAIDVQSSGRRGTFSLCFDTLVTYDFYERAIDIDTLLGICSADAEYSTIGGSSDMNASSCWGESPLHNRWFKFTAPAGGFADFTIDIGCVKGDQQRTYAAIWGSDGLREVACERYSSDNDDINVNSDTLTPGATYYLSVDVQSTGRVGSFTLCYDTVPDYDYRVAALDIDTLLGSCSADAEYTTIGASGDGDAGDCWNNSGPKLNRWFKFQAPASELVNINIKTGGTEGTINRILAGLWNEDGTEQIACSVYGANGADLEVNADELTEGATYYLAVDAFGRSHDGTFTICIDTTPSYDFYEGALDVTNLFGGCSEDAIYTTAGGTADKLAGDCWNNGGPLFNRWFKFTAPSNGVANITVDRGDGKGTQRRTQLALWGADGEEKIACSRFDEANDDVSLSYTELTPGGLYYISVDAFNINNDGTFTLCLDSNPGYDYIEGAYELTDLNNWCSEDEQFTTAGASPDSLAGSCWNNSGPLYNRWFKFTSLSTDFTVTVDIAGDKGNQRRTQLALWDADDMSSSLECARYTDNADDVTISTTSLEAGKEYFISVDVHSSTRVGTFRFV